VGQVRPTVIKYASGYNPFAVAFNPHGTRLAVGYSAALQVDVLDAKTLELEFRPSVEGAHSSTFHAVTWARDGQTLFAAGRKALKQTTNTVVAWAGAGKGNLREMRIRQNTSLSLVSLPDGDVLVAAADPWLGRLGSDGTIRWQHGPKTLEFLDHEGRLLVSSDGNCVDFSYDAAGERLARFNVAERRLILSPPADVSTRPPIQSGLPVSQWKNSLHPRVGPNALHLNPYERSRSLAIHPDLQRFVLGTDFCLRAFNVTGELLWERSSNASTRAVNISGDGRFVIGARIDGSIRWHRMVDGVELLAFMPLPDQTNWVLWTPDGFYASTADAHEVLRWHVNHGWDAPADSVQLHGIQGAYRPQFLSLVLQESETPRALGLAELHSYRDQLMIRTNSSVPRGSRLHLLAMGISAYNEKYAKHLQLEYASRDATDLARAVMSTQGSLYDIKPQVLIDDTANKAGLLRALKTIHDTMASGFGTDLAVIHFAGHGALIEEKLYLLPYEVDARDEVSIRASALPVVELRGELLELARHGRVLILLDACHAGAMTLNGQAIAFDSTALRTVLAAANITALTSSSANEVSIERADLQHGTFTKVLLDSFTDPAADIDHNRLISTLGLCRYVQTRVPTLTNGKQNPGMEIRFEGTLFASNA
jgi:hypothetical protein